MKEVYIVTVDDRIIGVYAKKRQADKFWEDLTKAARILNQINEHKILVKTMEMIE